MKAILPVLLAVLFCSCAGTPAKKEPAKAPPNAQREYQLAKSSLDANDTKKALARLKRLVQQHPASDVTDDAYMMMGNIHFSGQQYQEALTAYNSILTSGLATPLEGEAETKAAKSALKLQRFDEASALAEKALARSDLAPELAADALVVRYEVFSQNKSNLDALSTLVALSERHPNETEREKYKQLAQEHLDGRLSEDELHAVAEKSGYGFLQVPAKFRYALLLYEKRDFSRAKRYLSEIVAAAPGTPTAERAQQLVNQMDARQKVDARTIGVVLPLSGKQQAIGYKTLRGIQLGLGIYGKVPSNFRLAVIDSEGNPDVARRAVERLVGEDSPIAIIGGLLSKTAVAEAAKSQEYGVPFIALSQKAGITQIGNNVFRNALTSQMQVQHLVDVAMNQLKMSRFAIIYPNDAYGVEYANLFWDEVRAKGGSIQGAQPYDPKETDFRGHVQRLVGTFYLEDRATEYNLRLKAFNEKNPKKSARSAGSTAPEDILPPIVDFDAIFIPDSVKAVGQIAPMLAYNNVENVRLLGTNLWNSPSLVARGQKFVDSAVFVDSFLSSDKSFQNSEFFGNFKTAFEEEPGIFEVQGYDSALILRQIIASGESSRIGLAQRLATLQNFPGALGSLSVSGDREIKRPMAALTVQDGKVSKFDGQQKPQ